MSVHGRVPFYAADEGAEEHADEQMSEMQLLEIGLQVERQIATGGGWDTKRQAAARGPFDDCTRWLPGVNTRSWSASRRR